MTRLDTATLTLNALDKVIHAISRRCDRVQYLGCGESVVDMVAMYNRDIVDIQSIRDGVLIGDKLATTGRRIMFLDTAVREEVFDEFKKVGLQEELEATGQVKFFAQAPATP
jgi:hypothetical protein